MFLLTGISIIAVHGLNPRSKKDDHHAWDTWRTPPGPDGRLWLRDDLPPHVPGARIFLYEYNSTAAYGKDQNSFVGKADELLEDVHVAREHLTAGRPLLFLGHSMGGLLIKQALVLAAQNRKFAPIRDATAGLAFFATPHHGGERKRVRLGGVVTKVATTLGFQKGDDILETLKSGSVFSGMMREQWRHQVARYKIVSFWGGHDTVECLRSCDGPGVIRSNAHSGCPDGECPHGLIERARAFGQTERGPPHRVQVWQQPSRPG